MAADTPAKPKGLSLYANLLDPSSESSAPGTISRAPVVFKQPGSDAPQQDDASAQKQQISAAALRFQPTKRPQVQKPNVKPTPNRAFAPQPSVPKPAASTEDQASLSRPPPPKTTLADWTAEADEEEYGYQEKRQRGGRKKRKKNREEEHVSQNWDDIYDPSRPNNYEEYRNSDEKILEIRDWKDRLYAHRMKQRQSSLTDSDDDADHRPFNAFAPPTYHPPPPEERNPTPPPPPPPAFVPDDPTGDDAYARRMRLSQQNQNIPTPTTQPPPPPTNQSSAPNIPTPTIAKAPIRYNLPPAPEDIPKSEAELQTALEQEDAEFAGTPDDEAPRSVRPGQKGFAERLMSKYGWSKGTGLGANNSGIINPLRVQVEKQKKKPDAEGGGFVGPGGRGKIIGGKRSGGEDKGKFGAMSEVVILQNMLNGMDVQHELNEGNLRQEIGEECGEKYGRVERVYVDPSAPENAPVFIRFTSQLSALRAVNALEGRIFNGNTISARFFDTDDFDKNVLG